MPGKMAIHFLVIPLVDRTNRVLLKNTNSRVEPNYRLFNVLVKSICLLYQMLIASVNMYVLLVA